ncbi:helix-turn-helix transcriptional regulator [Paenirhodobacter hankyongi]|uniref:Helix-turn-helix transcriptional regulator n=1 Tax=Paenirhodobacter hankyongi TaxID=2294033 RepID=A0A421BIV2_9RHOB|nr:LuxR family transcriptional regulator [Sinirhodobacter hankyongi]RLL61374.1 helix-turn-helix transcriptional regulator [Sinirhodobacter hankyongi]
MDWNEASARAITALHGDGFAPALVTAIRSVVPFEHSVTFAYYGDRRPISLHADFPDWKYKVMVEDYQAGPYLLDPFYLHCADQPAPRLVRLRDVAPDRFYQGEYFRNYYVQTELAEEIGFMLPVGNDVHVVISAMREGRAFSAREFRDLGAIVPVVGALAAHHWADLADRFSAPTAEPDGQRLPGLIDAAFRKLGANLLTAREIEVVEYTLKGHSAEATGLALGISPGTVRIHRRNIYAKLHIGSQGELFSLFIATLGDTGIIAG